jgi:hypothetical protein
MISDISTLGTNGVKTEDQHETAAALSTGQRLAGEKATQQCQGRPCSSLIFPTLDSLPIQPVADVPLYLATRSPQPHYQGEEALLITLPATVQTEVRAMVRACHYVARLVSEKLSVQAACKSALQIYRDWHWKLNTFRQKFDAWAKAKDWVVLVNRAKAMANWRDEEAGLQDCFLAFVSMRYGQFARTSDGKRQAIISVWRQWKTGKNPDGDLQPVPGYEADWNDRDRENLPVGWSESNIRRQVKKFGKTTLAVLALLHDSESAARQFLPQVLGTRKGLRFLEKVTFDDVRTDWLIFNPKTGQAEEMWVLVARDEATAMVLGFVMLPATVREDGKATHLGARQMKELAGFLLQTYPLPPYLVHWVVERGTATLAEAVKAALGELFNNRIKVQYTSMIGDKSPVGYAERAKGNSRGKASHESHNRLFHTQGSFIGGQTGADYSIRPADLKARCDEAHGIWLQSRDLPEELREQVKYPLPTPAKAREHFYRFCLDQNFRTDHKLEDFEEVLEWWDGSKWQPRESAPAGATFRKRMEMPVERALRLIKSVEKWDRVSPDIIITFLRHNQRLEKIEASGEIKLTQHGKLLTFRNPAGQLTAGTKVLCYHNAEEPEFLHVTNGEGCILGTWALRGRGSYLDQEALAQAMRYTHAARETAKATAAELAAPQRAALDDMRAHNDKLQQFVVTGDVPTATGTETGTPVGVMLAGTAAGQKAARKQEDRRQRNLREFKGDVAELAEVEPAEAGTPNQDDFSADALL